MKAVGRAMNSGLTGTLERDFSEYVPLLGNKERYPALTMDNNACFKGSKHDLHVSGYITKQPASK